MAPFNMTGHGGRSRCCRVDDDDVSGGVFVGQPAKVFYREMGIKVRLSQDIWKRAWILGCVSVGEFMDCWFRKERNGAGSLSWLCCWNLQCSLYVSVSWMSRRAVRASSLVDVEGRYDAVLED